MVELARVPVPNTTTQPIKYNLTQADIASPYTAIAAASDKASQGLSDISVPLAQGAADKAVRTDDHGELIVDWMPPMVGDAAKAARLTMAAKMQPQVETDLLKLRLEHYADPTAFGKAAGEYKTKLMAKVGWDPALSTGIGKMLDNTTATNMRSTLVEQDNKALEERKQLSQARIKDASEQLTNLAYYNGTDSKEYTDKLADLRTLYGNLLGDKRSGYTQARVDQELNELMDANQGRAIIGVAHRQYQATKDQEGSKEAQQRWLYDQFLGEAGKKQLLHMPLEKRRQFFAEGRTMLDLADAKDADAIRANRELVHKRGADVFENPKAAWDERWYNDALQRSIGLNDPTAIRYLRALKDYLPLTQTIANMSGPELAKAREELRQGIRPDTHERFDLSSSGTVHIYDQIVAKVTARSAAEAARQTAALEERAKVPNSKYTKGEFEEAIRNADAGNKPELVRKLQSIYTGRVLAGEAEPGALNKVMEDIRQRKADSNLSPEAQKSLDVAETQIEAALKAWRTDTMTQAARSGTIERPVAPLDVGNPDAFAGGVTERNATAKLVQQRWRESGEEFGPVQVIQGADAENVAKQWMYGDPSNAAKTMLAISPRLSGDDFAATMKEEHLKSALLSVMKNPDPQRMPAWEAANRTLRELWRRDPADFEGAFGKEARDMVAAAAGQEGLPVPQIMANVQPTNDPKLKAAQDQNVKDAKEELKHFFTEGETASAVTGYIGGSYWPTWLHDLFAGPLSRPIQPPNGLEANAMVKDYEDIYTAQRKRGSDQDAARKTTAAIMRREWIPSVANRGQLMSNAPEKFYKPIGGSYDWLKDDVMGTLTAGLGPALVGPTLGPGPGGLIEPGVNVPISKWTFSRLVFDGMEGNDPKYQIWYRNDRGQEQMYQDPASHAYRFSFNPGTPRSEGVEPTGRYAEAEAKQTEALARGTERAKRNEAVMRRMARDPAAGPLMKGLAPFMPPSVANVGAHADWRDGGQ